MKRGFLNQESRVVRSMSCMSVCLSVSLSVSLSVCHNQQSASDSVFGSHDNHFASPCKRQSEEAGRALVRGRLVNTRLSSLCNQLVETGPDTGSITVCVSVTSVHCVVLDGPVTPPKSWPLRPCRLDQGTRIYPSGMYPWYPGMRVVSGSLHAPVDDRRARGGSW